MTRLEPAAEPGEAGEAVRQTQPAWPDIGTLILRVVIASAVLVLFLFVLQPYVERLWGLREASDWGSDWNWLQDGFDRLADGLPLVRPEYVAGPWSQFPAPAHAPTYAWSLHPPYSVVAYAPFLLAPAEQRPVVWAAVMALALGAAVWVAWPHRLWWGTPLLLVTILLWLPFVDNRSAVVDQIHYANPNALVMLGVALVWLGRQRGSVALMTIGLVLAALKIAPAGALGVWLLAARRDPWPARRAVALAVVILVLITIPVLLLDPGAIGDMIRSQANLVPWDGRTNLSPQLSLIPLLGETGALLVSYGIAGAMLLLILVRRLDGPGGLLIAATAPLLVTPQLWAHWLLIPAVALLATLSEWPAIRFVDDRLAHVFGRPERAAAPA